MTFDATPSPQRFEGAHPARARLDATSRRWPEIWRLVEAMRLQGAEKWNPAVFLPLTAASGVLTEHRRQRGLLRAPGGMIGAQASEAAELAAMASWRMTQGIYRYDPTLYAALLDTPISGDLPCSLLFRLPEWCVYIEAALPLATVDGGSVEAHGAWVWLDQDERDGSMLLWIGWDVPNSAMSATALPLVGTLDASVDRVIAQWHQSRTDGAVASGPRAGLLEQYRATVAPMLSLILYLCAEAPDITGKGLPGNPAPVRTRRGGWRAFPAQGSRTWDVGVRMGAALRSAYAADGESHAGAVASGRGIRPHVRRAHWHTFLSGPRLRSDRTPIPSKERAQDVRWMPPVAVALEDVAVLPATIRPVR